MIQLTDAAVLVNNEVVGIMPNALNGSGTMAVSTTPGQMILTRKLESMLAAATLRPSPISAYLVMA